MDLIWRLIKRLPKGGKSTLKFLRSNKLNDISKISYQLKRFKNSLLFWWKETETKNRTIFVDETLIENWIEESKLFRPEVVLWKTYFGSTEPPFNSNATNFKIDIGLGDQKQPKKKLVSKIHDFHFKKPYCLFCGKVFWII